MEEKTIYVTPKMEVIVLNEDVILTSNTQSTEEDGNNLWGGF